MKKFNKLFKTLTVSLLSITFLLSGCAEKKEIKHLVKNIQRVEKSYFKTNDKDQRFIFAQSVIRTPLDAETDLYSGVFPGNTSSFTSALIRFEFTEHYLNVIKITPRTDSSIIDPGTSAFTETTIVRYPVQKHVDIWLARDDYGDKTNREEETEILHDNWRDRKYAVIDFKGEQVIDSSVYNEIFRSYYSDDFEGASAKGELLELVLSDEIINITQTKTFTMRNGGTSPLLQVRSSFLPEPISDYIPMEYPLDWERKVGFFKTERFEEEAYSHLNKTKVLVNRWDPRKQITYYLSEQWKYPHNTELRKIAYEVIANWNEVFKKATGIDEFIILKDSDGTQTFGDLRYNVIYLVDEKENTGLLGYGPSVAHPFTGEILNANTVIYGGTLRRAVMSTKLVEEEKSGYNPETTTGGSAKTMNGSDAYVSSDRKEMMNNHLSKNAIDIEKYNQMIGQFTLNNRYNEKFEKIKTFLNTPFVKTNKIREDLNIMTEALLEQHHLETDFHSSQKNGCFYHLQADKIFAGHEKGMRDDQILREMLFGTLTHEVGHNLGLRHNFRGSHDKKNFWKDEDGNDKWHSSSVMEYENNPGKELQKPGNYDNAAIMLAYGSDSLPAVESSDFTDFTYEFCTDHQAYNVDAFCNPFDRGTTASEIVDGIADDYHGLYNLTNKSSKYIKKYDTYQDIMSYLGRLIFRRLIPARKFLDYRNERWYQLIVETGTFHDNEPEIIDLNEGAAKGYHFLLSVLYNDKEDLTQSDRFTYEADVIGIIYDRMYAGMFLSLESIGWWQGSFNLKTDYPSMFEEPWFLDNGYSEEYFYKTFGRGPSGFYQKYNYYTQSFEGDQKNMRPEIRNLMFEDLFYWLDTEGNAIPDNGKIDVKLMSNLDVSSFENKTRAAFLNQLSQVKEGNTELNNDIAYLQNISSIYEMMLNALPEFVIGSDEYIESETLRSDLTTAKNELDNLIVTMSGMDASTTFDELLQVSDGVYTALNKYQPIYDQFIITKDKGIGLVADYTIKIVNGAPVIDSNGKVELSDAYVNIKSIIKETSAFLDKESDTSFLNFIYKYQRSEVARHEGIYEDIDKFYIYDKFRLKMIEIPKNSIITNMAAVKHYELVSENYLSRKALDEFNNIPSRKELGRSTVRLMGYDLADGDYWLFNYYTDFDTNGGIKRERDFIFEMYDIFQKYDPGNPNK